MRGLPLPGFGMDQLCDQAQVPRLSGDRKLGKPDAVCEQRVSAGVHDTVEGGVVGVGKRVEAVLGRRLQDALHLDQGICQLGCFG